MSKKEEILRALVKEMLDWTHYKNTNWAIRAKVALEEKDTGSNKITISKDQWGEYCAKEVEAILVGGWEGVFAVYRKDGLIFFAAGDDGSWWDIFSFHPRWIKEIVKAIIQAM